MKVFLFDIDGTLLLSGGAGLKSLNRVFKEAFAIEPTFQSIQADGKTDPLILEELFFQVLKRKPSEDEISLIADLYCRIMVEELPLSPRFRLMPGALEFLEAVSQLPNIILGLATGNLEPMAWLKLKKAGMDHFFKFGGFGSDSKIRRELTLVSLERARSHLGSNTINEIFVVGDTIHDIDCAHHIGAKSIAVATGNTPPDVLKSHRPHYFFPTLIEARQALPSIIS